MKSPTPQEIANCYGVFIADLFIVAKVLPTVNTWFATALPDVSTIYKLNLALFSNYTASITSFPTSLRRDFRGNTTSGVKVYNNSVSLAWTAMTIDLKNALTCANVDPAQAAKILASFAKLKPREEFVKDYKR